MAGRHLPSVDALEAADDALLRAELEQLSVRRQVAVVRALADELDRLGPASADCLRPQFVEELARLGCRVLETAAALADGTNREGPQRPSGVWPATHRARAGTRFSA